MNPRTTGFARKALGMLAMVALAAVALGSSAPRVTMAAPGQQVLSCKWQNIGSSRGESFHGASAMDTDENVVYWYGGANSDLSTSNKVEATDLSGANLSATARQVSAGSALLVVGAAGAYRAKGAKADGSAAYYFGGLKDGNNGLAIDNVQRYVTKTSKWEQVIVPTGSLIPRAWATATYDPGHDVIWVIGGVSSCQMQPVMQGQPCQARSLAIQYLTFDPATGEPKEWKKLAIETASFAGVAVYDSTMKRLLLHGGTSDIKTGSSTLQALDLSDADPAAAKLADLTAMGTAPSLYFHGGAYDSAHNWLVVYGGVKRNYFQSNESADTTTMALDLGAAPSPTWKNLSPTGNPGERVGGGLVYDPKHMAVIETLGRTKIAFSSGTPPMPTPEVAKAIHALTCTSAGAPTPSSVPPTSMPGGPTATPRPTSAAPSEPGPDAVKACPQLEGHAPAAAIAAAVAGPNRISGYGTRCSANVSGGPTNPYRRNLTLRNIGIAFHPLYNGFILRCGCP